MADVAQAVVADMMRSTTRQQQQRLLHTVDVVNVVDDEPAPRGDVEVFAEQLLQQCGDTAGSVPATQPRVSSAQSEQQGTNQQQPRQQSRQRGLEPLEEKRVRNGKLKQLLEAELQGQLQAPTYREGLKLILAGLTPYEQVDIDCLF